MISVKPSVRGRKIREPCCARIEITHQLKNDFRYNDILWWGYDLSVRFFLQKSKFPFRSHVRGYWSHLRNSEREPIIKPRKLILGSRYLFLCYSRGNIFASLKVSKMFTERMALVLRSGDFWTVKSNWQNSGPIIVWKRVLLTGASHR
jgi:hypothetical protein